MGEQEPGTEAPPRAKDAGSASSSPRGQKGPARRVEIQERDGFGERVERIAASSPPQPAPPVRAPAATARPLAGQPVRVQVHPERDSWWGPAIAAAIALLLLVAGVFVAYKVWPQDDGKAADNGSGDTVLAQDASFADRDAPQLMDLRVPIVATTTATITWFVSDASGPVLSQLYYGTTGSDLRAATIELGGGRHTVQISDLHPGTTYRFQVRAADGIGNEASSPLLAFTTQFLPPIPAPSPAADDGLLGIRLDLGNLLRLDV